MEAVIQLPYESHHMQSKRSFAGHPWPPQKASWWNILAENMTLVLLERWGGGWEEGESVGTH